MSSYLFTKKAKIKVGSKVYHKDQTITAEEAGEENVKRLLRKGYIRLIGNNLLPASARTAAQEDDEAPFYLTQDDFLSPEQVNKLLKPQLIEYAAHINFVDINPNSKAADLKKDINSFIAEMSFDDSEEDGGGEEENGDTEDENGNEETEQ